MNVLFLDSIECDTYGGMEEWIRLVARGLRRRSHGILVAGRSSSEFLRRVKATDIPTLELSISGDFNPLTIARVRRQLVTDEIDVVCVNFTKDIRLGGLAARWSGSARVVWSVGLDITKDSLSHRWFTPKLIDSVIVPSESLKGQVTALRYIQPDTVTVIPVGIDDLPGAGKSSEASSSLCTQFQLPDDAIIAVTVGRFVEQKGHVTLIDALPDIIRRKPNIRLLFLGNGPLESAIHSRADALGLDRYVVFGGMRDDVAPIVAGADLMIHPSIEEPFGIAILEGMRAGLPIVASDVGGIPEVVGSTGGAMLVEPRNPSALADAVVEIVSDQVAAREMGARNRRRFVECFSVDTMIDRVEARFKSICQAEPQRG